MKMKKKYSIPLITVVAVILAIGGSIIVRNLSIKHELNSYTKAVVSDMAASQWNRAVIMKHSSQQMQIWLIQNNIQQAPDFITGLGKVAHYNGIEKLQYASPNGVKTAALTADIAFENGEAKVYLALSKQDDKWLLDSFTVDPTQKTAPSEPAAATAPAPAAH